VRRGSRLFVWSRETGGFLLVWDIYRGWVDSRLGEDMHREPNHSLGLCVCVKTLILENTVLGKLEFCFTL